MAVYYQINNQIMDQQTTVPSFSLFQLGEDSTKACFESPQTVVISSLAGPYFDRRRVSLDPIFNCSISGVKLTDQVVGNMSRKLKEILRLVIVNEKYLRMNFDLAFQVVEASSHSDLFCALVNLLSFALMLAGVEIRSVFSCACAWLLDEKIHWSEPKSAGWKKAVLAMEQAGKELIHFEFEGEYSFLHSQKLTNTLMDASEQFSNYMVKKIGEQEPK